MKSIVIFVQKNTSLISHYGIVRIKIYNTNTTKNNILHLNDTSQCNIIQPKSGKYKCKKCLKEFKFSQVNI